MLLLWSLRTKAPPYFLRGIRTKTCLPTQVGREQRAPQEVNKSAALLPLGDLQAPRHDESQRIRPRAAHEVVDEGCLPEALGQLPPRQRRYRVQVHSAHTAHRRTVVRAALHPSPQTQRVSHAHQRCMLRRLRRVERQRLQPHALPPKRVGNVTRPRGQSRPRR